MHSLLSESQLPIIAHYRLKPRKIDIPSFEKRGAVVGLSADAPNPGGEAGSGGDTGIAEPCCLLLARICC